MNLLIRGESPLEVLADPHTERAGGGPVAIQGEDLLDHLLFRFEQQSGLVVANEAAVAWHVRRDDRPPQNPRLQDHGRHPLAERGVEHDVGIHVRSAHPVA